MYMDNPTMLQSIDNDLILSNGGNYLGQGIKTFKVNRTAPNDILTCHGTVNLATAGAYITEGTGTAYQINQMPVLTNTTAKQFELFGNAAGAIAVVKVIGVDANNNEITENVSINGTAVTNTVNNYKCVNDIIQVSGNMMYSGRIITCRPAGGTPYNIRYQIGGDFKLNPMFMCSKKNGKNRKARLVSIDSTYFFTANSHLNLHVFSNNEVTTGTLGRFNVALRIYDIPLTNTPIFFGEESCIEIEPGETAVFFKENSTTTVFMSWTWEIYYTE